MLTRTYNAEQNNIKETDLQKMYKKENQDFMKPTIQKITGKNKKLYQKVCELAWFSSRHVQQPRY